jgi:hypothetical protein
MPDDIMMELMGACSPWPMTTVALAASAATRIISKKRARWRRWIRPRTRVHERYGVQH